MTGDGKKLKVYLAEAANFATASNVCCCGRCILGSARPARRRAGRGVLRVNVPDSFHAAACSVRAARCERHRLRPRHAGDPHCAPDHRLQHRSRRSQSTQRSVVHLHVRRDGRGVRARRAAARTMGLDCGNRSEHRISCCRISPLLPSRRPSPACPGSAQWSPCSTGSPMSAPTCRTSTGSADPGSIGAAARLQDAYFAGGRNRQLIAVLAPQPDAVLVSAETVSDFQLQPGRPLTAADSRTGAPAVSRRCRSTTPAWSRSSRPHPGTASSWPTRATSPRNGQRRRRRVPRQDRRQRPRPSRGGPGCAQVLGPARR